MLLDSNISPLYIVFNLFQLDFFLLNWKSPVEVLLLLLLSLFFLHSLLKWTYIYVFSSVQLVSHVWLCDPTDCSTLGFPVYYQLQELAQTPVHWVGDAIQPSHFLLSPFPPAFNLFQHQGLFSELALRIRWPKYWSFNFSVSPSNIHSGLISLRIDWFDLLAVQGTLKSLLQHHSSKASILWCTDFFIVQLSHSYMTTGKAIGLTRWTFVGKVMSLLFNMLSRLIITFLPRRKHLNFMTAAIIYRVFGAQENKISHCFHCLPIYLPWNYGTRCHDISFLNVEL